MLYTIDHGSEMELGEGRTLVLVAGVKQGLGCRAYAYVQPSYLRPGRLGRLFSGNFPRRFDPGGFTHRGDRRGAMAACMASSLAEQDCA